MTLRRRVFVYVAAAAILSCALTVGMGAVLVRHRLASQRLAVLERQANVVAAALDAAPGALGTGPHVYRVENGRVQPLGDFRASLVLAAIGNSGATSGTVSLAGHLLLFVARLTPAGRIVLVRSAGLSFAEWRPFLWLLVLAGLAGAALAGVFSYLLARRLTRPIGELAQATERVAAGESDVTVAVHGEDELAGLGATFNRMSADLSRARDAQRNFLESVSHELKTPLTSIRGYAEAIGDGAVAPEEGSAVITSEADRLERLVGDLLELSRLGRAEFDVEHVPLDLAELAARAVERHLPRAHELGLTLSSTAEPGSAALGDEGRVLQALSNLIENALRLTPEGGSVTVAAAPGSVAVRDTGPGLSPEDLPRAFERFYLYDHYRSQRAVGSGLGLAIVHELAAAMGGSVSVESAPGEGAEFVLSLPSVAGVPEAAPGERAAAAQPIRSSSSS